MSAGQLTHLLQSGQSQEAGFGHHVPDVEQGLLDNQAERLMELDATQVHVQNPIQSLAEAEVRVVQHPHV